MVVPFAPGGGLDLTARILAQRLTERVGQSFIVENRTGASGIIGTEFVAKAAPDGYTLLVGSQTTQAVVPAMYKVSYDTSRDFVGVTESGSSSRWRSPAPGSFPSARPPAALRTWRASCSS
jgi:tripartite-type tricarboxylate transporter receptor subunit TctC